MDVLDARLTRRNALRVSMGTAGAAVLGSLPLAGCGGGDVASPQRRAGTGGARQRPPPSR